MTSDSPAGTPPGAGRAARPRPDEAEGVSIADAVGGAARNVDAPVRTGNVSRSPTAEKRVGSYLTRPRLVTQVGLAAWAVEDGLAAAHLNWAIPAPT